MSTGNRKPAAHIERPHAARPTDLVALVTFDGEVYANQAVTRDRLARPEMAPHVLNAVIEQWLGRGRRTWIDVEGRQINGIATARRLAGGNAWIVDTLIDARPDRDGVVLALLRQVCAAAAQEGMSRVLLRVAADAPALPGALRAGFAPAVHEQLWSGASLKTFAIERQSDGGPQWREATDEDDLARFQLYNRSLPMGGRQALALTLDEWRQVQERRWLGRGAREYLAFDGDRMRAELRLVPGEVGQFDLLADAEGAEAAALLLDRAAEELAGCARVLVLAPRCAAPLERLLEERGLEAGAEYRLLCRRIARPVAERVRVTAGVAVSGGV